MAGTINILTLDDFTGYFALADKKNTGDAYEADLEDDTLYKLYLSKLMGDTLSTAFIDDLDTGVPQTAKWTAIFDPFTFTDNFGKVQRCEGVKIMLKRYFYLKFAENNIVTMGSNGNYVQGLENGKYDYSRYCDINNQLYVNVCNFYSMLILNPTDYPNLTTEIPCLATPF